MATSNCASASPPSTRARLAENVLVTVGAIQANYTALLTVTDPGDKIAVMQPNYQQFWGLAQNLGREMQTFNLKEHVGWALDLDELQDAVGARRRSSWPS